MVLKRVRIRHCRYCYSRRPLESVTCLFMPSSLMVTLRVRVSIIFCLLCMSSSLWCVLVAYYRALRCVDLSTVAMSPMHTVCTSAGGVSTKACSGAKLRSSKPEFGLDCIKLAFPVGKPHVRSPPQHGGELLFGFSSSLSFVDYTRCLFVYLKCFYLYISSSRR